MDNTVQREKEDIPLLVSGGSFQKGTCLFTFGGRINVGKSTVTRTETILKSGIVYQDDPFDLEL